MEFSVSDSTSISPISLGSLYSKASSLFRRVEEESPVDVECFKDAIRAVEVALERVKLEGCFSSNEVIDDVSTNSLGYLFLPFWYGKICAKCPIPTDRLVYLTNANAHFSSFIEKCKNLHILREDELDFSEIQVIMET
jgi:hypothetical protein